MRRNQPQQIPQNPQSQQIFKPVGKYWMIFAFVLIIDIAAVVLPLMSYLKISSLTQIEDHIYLQDGKMQIKDIIMLKEQDNKLEECPLGYHDLFKYTFHGLHPFYLCQQQIIPYVEEKVYVDEKEQCRFFADMDPVQFQVLKLDCQFIYMQLTNLGKDSIRICGKYMDRNIQLKKSCDENEIVCSFIKDQESYMCAYEVSDCPINQILLNENQGQDGKFQQSLKFIKQAPNSMPITDFDIVEGSVKCKQQNSKLYLFNFQNLK